MGRGGNPPEQIKPTDIKVGDAIGAMGEVDASAKSVGAVAIVLLDPERAKQMEEMRANYGKTWMMGKVTAIDGVKVTIMGSIDNAAHRLCRRRKHHLPQAPRSHHPGRYPGRRHGPRRGRTQGRNLHRNCRQRHGNAPGRNAQRSPQSSAAIDSLAAGLSAAAARTVSRPPLSPALFQILDLGSRRHRHLKLIACRAQARSPSPSPPASQSACPQAAA